MGVVALGLSSMDTKFGAPHPEIFPQFYHSQPERLKSKEGNACKGVRSTPVGYSVSEK